MRNNKISDDYQQEYPWMSFLDSLQTSGQIPIVRNPYFPGSTIMLAKITSKNQLTLPKSITDAINPTEYFEVEIRNGQIVLTPVRIQRSDAVRAKLAELDLQDRDIKDAVNWARAPAKSSTKPPGKK